MDNIWSILGNWNNMIHFKFIFGTAISAFVIILFQYCFPFFLGKSIFYFGKLGTSLSKMHSISYFSFLSLRILLRTCFVLFLIFFIVSPSITLLTTSTSSSSIFGWNSSTTVYTFLWLCFLIFAFLIARSTHLKNPSSAIGFCCSAFDTWSIKFWWEWIFLSTIISISLFNYSSFGAIFLLPFCCIIFYFFLIFLVIPMVVTFPTHPMTALIGNQFFGTDRAHFNGHKGIIT